MKARAPILLTVAYGAGLMTGLLRFLNPFCAVALPVALILVARRPLITTLGLAFLLGSLSGRIAWIRESSGCAANSLPESSV